MKKVRTAFGLTVLETKPYRICLTWKAYTNSETRLPRCLSICHQQTNKCVYLAGTTNDTPGTSVEIARRMRQAWGRYRRYAICTIDRPWTSASRGTRAHSQSKPLQPPPMGGYITQIPLQTRHKQSCSRPIKHSYTAVWDG